MRVFLSHSTHDKDFVVKLADCLRLEGFDPWLCEISIHPADNWVEAINEGLKIADFFLLVWSPEACSSYATELEWTSAIAREISERRVRLGVVLLRDHPLPELLRTRQYIDARRNADAGIAATVNWLKQRRAVGRSAGSQAPVYLPDFYPKNLIVRPDLMNKMRDALVGQSGMFLLSGEPGTGKSTLAWMFGRESQKEFDAVVFQTCGDRPVEMIVAELAGQLQGQLGDISALAPERKLREIKNWLRGRQTLLILDDVWLAPGPAVAADAATLKIVDLIPGAEVSVLFTSRQLSLPWIAHKQREIVEVFTPEEAEAVFLNYLGDKTVNTHKQVLLEFANRMGRLPMAVTVGADLLRNQFGPLSQAARELALKDLHNEFHSVSDLLKHAIASQGGPESRLLEAGSICVAEGFWLPLAATIAGLPKAEAMKARDHLVNASLLRVVDQERQRFQLHALLREQILATVSSPDTLRAAHAAALEFIFRAWETQWRVCHECLEEIIPAFQFLCQTNQSPRGAWLSFYGFACAQRIGELHTALRILRQEEEFWKTRGDIEGRLGLQRAYSHQAGILIAWDQLDQSWVLLEKQQALCEQLGDKQGLQACYGNQARILRIRGRLEEALTLLRKQEAICEELKNKDGLQANYGSQARILQTWGRLEEALALLKRQQVICWELGNKDYLGWSYGSQASILQAWGRLEEALALLKKQEEICEELGSKQGLQECYGSQASILKAWGKLEQALELHKKQETICLELKNRNGLQSSYGDQALILRDWGRLKEALSLLKKQEAICEELENKHSLHLCYGNQALILMGWGQLEESLVLLKKQETICEELGNRDGLQLTYGNQALILMGWGQLDESMALLKKQEAICLELGNRDGLQRSYGNQARIFIAREKWKDALTLLKKQEALCKELKYKDGLQQSYGNQAVILTRSEKWGEALTLLKKQEELCIELGNKAGLQDCYGKQAPVLIALGRLDEGLTLLREQEAICLELKYKAALGHCYWIWGLAAQLQGDKKIEKEKLMAARDIFAELKMPQMRDALDAEILKAETIRKHWTTIARLFRHQ
ncbi:MAG TPA: TIR domain-containing protein [Candidatus Sulfotelmatobacter sp.]|nr:TIR domain-containing protein [Candidatus Sulfotelmatobacter sp.]